MPMYIEGKQYILGTGAKTFSTSFRFFYYRCSSFFYQFDFCACYFDFSSCPINPISMSLQGV